MRTSEAGGTSDGVAAVAAVAAGLAALAAADPADPISVDDAALGSEIVELITASHRLQAEITRRVAAFDARRLAGADGARTTRAWLRSSTGMSGVAAHRLVAHARVCQQLPELAAAAQAGSVSPEHVGSVVRLAAQVGLAEVARLEPTLAQAASELDVASFGQVCDRVRAHVDPDGPDPARAFAARGLSLSPVAGSLTVRGQLDPEGGATLATAVDAIMTPPTDGDDRTAAQRRADALVELARRSLITGDLPTVGGQRPQVGVLLYPQALSPQLLRRLAVHHRDTDAGRRLTRYAHQADAGVADRSSRNPDASNPDASNPDASNPHPDSAGGADGGRRRWRSTRWSDPPFLDHIGHVPPAVAQRIACDADVWRLILDPETGAPLDVGRSHRLVPYWIRKALHARDRGCRFPGCHTPAHWTDAHHLTPWAEGGATAVDSCVLLCRHHHGLVHEGGWSITMASSTGAVTVTRPGGVPYTPRYPRPMAA